MNSLLEGTHYKTKAIQKLADSGLFSESISKDIIDALCEEDIHAFVRCPNWLEKYLLGIVRMLIEESNGNPQKAVDFLTSCPSVFEPYLVWILENRNSTNASKLDNAFINEMSYQDVKNELNIIYDELETSSRSKLDTLTFGDSEYELVPIESYEQMNRLYGGAVTGDETGDGSEWCHANQRNVYKNWTADGEKMFVLQRNDWKTIPYDELSGEEYKGKDDYGLSLIAIRVSPEGRLLNATLRCNHKNVDRMADNQFKTFADLSEVTGMNVEEEIRPFLNNDRLDL